MNQIKVLEQILKDDRENKIEVTLKAISLIITAVGSLYSQPSYRESISECLSIYEKDLVDTEKPYGNIYSMHTNSSHNRLINLFKELNNLEWNYMRGDYLVTKAISKLGPVIMSDPYPSNKLILILNVIKDLKYKMNSNNLEIYLNLLETYKLALLKFRTCPTKANYDLRTVHTDQFFETLIRFLDDSEVHKILEEVLELDKNEIDILDKGFTLNTTKSLQFINRIFKNNQENCSCEDKILIKSLILSSLECLDIILEMIHSLLITKKNKNLNEKSHNLHQHHMANLSVIIYIREALLSNSSFMTDFDDNKLLITIASYVHFEDRYSVPVHERNLRVKDNTNMVVSYDSLFNVSSIALRCLTQIIRIWELSPVSRRPSLVSYLSYSENGFSNIDTII